MKALKYPLTVRDKDGKEWEVTEYDKYPDGEEYVSFDKYDSQLIDIDCEWVEAEQSVTDSNYVKNCSTCKYGLVLYRDKLPKFRNRGKMIFNCIDVKKEMDNEKIHPTQKPIELLEYLIKTFTDEGDVVIDPVAGSGSTLVAAENLNRKAYGFEIKKDFFMKANSWIESNRTEKSEIRELGYAKTKLSKVNPILF